jgi:hypothetical protein
VALGSTSATRCAWFHIGAALSWTPFIVAGVSLAPHQPRSISHQGPAALGTISTLCPLCSTSTLCVLCLTPRGRCAALALPGSYVRVRSAWLCIAAFVGLGTTSPLCCAWFHTGSCVGARLQLARFASSLGSHWESNGTVPCLAPLLIAVLEASLALST